MAVKHFQTRMLMLLLSVALLPFAVGCQTLSPAENIENGKQGNWLKGKIKSERWHPFKDMMSGEAESEFGAPLRMAVIWKDAVYEEAGKRPARGFGGRIFFYDADNQAIKVDGQLTVYGYDDSKKRDLEQPSENKADRKYVFRSTEFQTHYGKSDLGHSYSVWLPWDKVGGERKSITLIPVFKTEASGVVRGGSSINVLPGKDPHEEVAEMEKKSQMIDVTAAVMKSRENAQKSGVQHASFVAGGDTGHDSQQISFQASESVQQARRDRPAPSTFRINESLAQRLAELPAQTMIAPAKSVAPTRKINDLEHRQKIRDAYQQRKTQAKAEVKSEAESKTEFVEMGASEFTKY